MKRSSESLLMRLLIALNLESMAWALRRYHVPVHKNDLVLEVGSGGNPYPRSNVLLDAYENTRERFWAPLTSDRPTVLGFAEDLPFKNKAFDFVICAHVLEHSKDPVKFLSELQRVAKSGYIEVPDAFFERLNPYRDHRLEITSRNQKLIITRKSNWIHDPLVVDLYENRVKNVFTSKIIRKFPFDFHVRYYWDKNIEFDVVNPEVDLDWAVPEGNNYPVRIGKIDAAKERIRDLFRNVFSQRARNKTINVVPFLRCTKCHGNIVAVRQTEHLACDTCGTTYAIRNGIFVMNE